MCFCYSRLYDVMHSEKKLTIVFEYCDQVIYLHYNKFQCLSDFGSLNLVGNQSEDWKTLISITDNSLSKTNANILYQFLFQDLKKYFDSCQGEIEPSIVKV